MGNNDPGKHYRKPPLIALDGRFYLQKWTSVVCINVDLGVFEVGGVVYHVKNEANRVYYEFSRNKKDKERTQK